MEGFSGCSRQNSRAKRNRLLAINLTVATGLWLVLRLVLKIERRPTGPWLQVARRLPGYGFGEAAGAALMAGETAGEASAGVVTGDDPGDDCGFAGAGEVCAG